MALLASPVRTPLGLIRTGKFGIRAAGAGGTDAPANHPGVDIRAAIGTPVYPIAPGTVVEIRRNWRSLTAPGTIEGERIFTAARGGNLVVVRSKVGDVDYGHLNGVAAQLRVGQEVALDTLLGYSGRTGVVEPHLHLGIDVRSFVNGRPVWRPIDPTPLLPWTGDKFGQLTIEEDNDMAQVPDAEWQEALQTIRAIRSSQITPAGYTYDAAILPLVQGLYKALEALGTSAPIDFDGVAAQLREELREQLDDGQLADDVVDALVARIKPTSA